MVRATAGMARSVALCLGLFCGVLGSAGAAAQDAVGYPSSLERDPLLAWLRRETDIVPDRVVAVTPQALTSIVSTFPAAAGQGPRAVIRAEALSAETFARTGSLSWHVSLTADCPGRRIRLGETAGYARRNLLGERRMLREADRDWRAPEAGTALESAWRAACDPAFRGPFQGRDAKVAQVEGKAKPAAPAAGRTSGFVAQIGASPSNAEAERLIAALGDRAQGRPTWVETAQVGGRAWRRAVVGGFADAAEAQAFCAGLKASGRACFVRKPG